MPSILQMDKVIQSRAEKAIESGDTSVLDNRLIMHRLLKIAPDFKESYELFLCGKVSREEINELFKNLNNE